jgi:L-threonylcarbamoyladenylate synthase
MRLPQSIWNDKKLVKVLQNKGMAVMPTDTIYGVVGSALDIDAVNRIYNVRKRAPDKPCIILIGNTKELEKFSINLSNEQKNKIKEYWPGPVSIVLDCLDEKFFYLHRGTKTLAFRLPAQKDLCDLLKRTGPLIAPSANTEGLPPARDIEEAQKYFGDSVDLYIDGGTVLGQPSKIVKLGKNGVATPIRN